MANIKLIRLIAVITGSFIVCLALLLALPRTGSYAGADRSLASHTLAAPKPITLQSSTVATATLTLSKTVVTDHGGTAAPTDWMLTASGPITISGAGSVSDAVNVGTYDLSEGGGPSGYDAGDWVCDGGTQDDSDTISVASGEAVTCEITNDDKAAHLTLRKTVVNDHGGEALKTDWTLRASGPTEISGADGVNKDVAASSYDLSENDGPSGYAAGDWVCVGGSQDDADTITLGLGESATCTITNTYINKAPIARDDTASTDIGAVVIKVTDNDEDPEDYLNKASVEVTNGPSHGDTVVNTANGWITYTPSPGFSGLDTFVYRVGDDEPLYDSATVSVTVAAPDLTLSKSDGNITVSPGDPIVYILSYKNEGNKDANDVTIREVVPTETTFDKNASTGSWSCADGSSAGKVCTLSVGTLEKNSTTKNVNFAVRVNNPLTRDLDEITNRAEITTSDDELDTSNNADTESTPLKRSIGVTASKVAGLVVDADNSTLPSPGDTVRYTITVAHAGDAPAAGVVLSDMLDSNTELVNGSVNTSAGSVAEGNQPGDSSVRVNIGAIGAEVTVIVTYDVLINNPLPVGVAEIVNQAFVQGRDFPEIPSDDPTLPGNTDKTVLSLVAKPDLSAIKVFGFDPGSGEDGIGAPGDTLVYTVTVVNSGNQGATSVVITDVVDSNTTLITGTVATTQGAITSGNDAGDTSVRVDAGAIDGGGGDMSVTFKVRINDTISAGAKGILNQAEISAAGQPDLKSDDPNFDGAQDPTFTSISADVNVIASMTAFFRTDTNMNNVADSGDELLYYVQIVNTGSRAAAGAVYENILSPQISTPDDAVNSDMGEVTAGNIFGSESVVVSLGDLPGGGEARISYRVVIDNTVGLPDLFDSGQGDSKVLTNQGVVRYTNQETGQLVEVLTDDPNQPGTEDKTPMIVHGADTIYLPMLSR